MEFINQWKPDMLQAEKKQSPLGSQAVELFQKCFFALPACFSSVNLKEEDSSHCYQAIHELDALAARIEQALPPNLADEYMTVCPRHVAEVVSQSTGIPVPVLPAFGSVQISHLEEKLLGRVSGQDLALDAIVRSFFSPRKLPLDPTWLHSCRWVSLLFLGPSGVGMTEIAKCIAEVFFGDASRLIRVDMSEYTEVQPVGKSSRCISLVPGILLCPPLP